MYDTFNQIPMVLSNFKFNLYWTVALFYRSKIISHSVYVINKKTKEDILIQL